MFEPDRPRGLRQRSPSADDGLVRFRSPLFQPRLVRLLGLLTAIAFAALVIAPAPAGALISGEFGLQPREVVPGAVAALQYHRGPVIAASNTYTIYWDPNTSYPKDVTRTIDEYFHNVGAASGQLSNVFALSAQYTGAGGTRATYNSTWRGAYTDRDNYPGLGCSVGPVCLTDAQIRTELESFIAANNLPTGLGYIYFVLTPPGVTVCTDGGTPGKCSVSSVTEEEEKKGVEPNGFCSYHSAAEASSPSPIIYAVQPWVAGEAGRVIKELPVETEGATKEVLDCQNRVFLVEPHQTGVLDEFGNYESGLADVLINDLSIEQNNMVADPLLNGWYQNGTNAEQSDLCQGVFSPAPEQLPKVPETTKALPFTNETINENAYYLQWQYSSVAETSGKGITCWSAVDLEPHFTTTNPVNPGNIVAFDGYESVFSLDANPNAISELEPFTLPVYTWNFGDGSPEVGSETNASVFHAYRYGGVYKVTLTVTDSGGYTGSITKEVPVAGVNPFSGGSPGGSPSPGAARTAPAAANRAPARFPDQSRARARSRARCAAHFAAACSSATPSTSRLLGTSRSSSPPGSPTVCGSAAPLPSVFPRARNRRSSSRGPSSLRPRAGTVRCVSSSLTKRLPACTGCTGSP